MDCQNSNVANYFANDDYVIISRQLRDLERTDDMKIVKIIAQQIRTTQKIK